MYYEKLLFLLKIPKRVAKFYLKEKLVSSRFLNGALQNFYLIKKVDFSSFLPVK